MEAVKVNHIRKTFQAGKERVVALQDVSFSVAKGELFGLIGPDGAGKTTLFRILTTLMLAESGDATVDGLDVVKDFKQIRHRVGYMPGKFSLYQDLTVEENLNFFATIFNTTIEQNYDLVKEIYSHIEKFKKRKAGALSGGMKQKLALSCALIHRPSILFLDEPTTGVDAVSRREFWDLLRSLQEQKITIIVSTPYMDEASLCERVALMQQGQILDIDTPKGITRKFAKPIWTAAAPNMFQLMTDLRALKEVETCYPFGQQHHVILTLNADPMEVRKQMSAKGHEMKFERTEATIEDSFIDLMNSNVKTASR